MSAPVEGGALGVGDGKGDGARCSFPKVVCLDWRKVYDRIAVSHVGLGVPELQDDPIPHYCFRCSLRSRL